MKCLDVLEQPVLRFLEEVAYPIVVLDEGSRFVRLNRAFSARFGPAVERIVGRQAGELLSEAHRTAFLGWHAEWQEGRSTPRRVVLSMPSGRHEPSWIFPLPLRDAAGQYVGCAVVMIDEAKFGRAILQAFREASGLLQEVLLGLARDVRPATSPGDPREQLAALRRSVPELAGLTDREWEVARRMGGGDRSSQIATDLDISASTVRNHLKSIYRKTGIRSQADLLRRFRAWQRSAGERS